MKNLGWSILLAVAVLTGCAGTAHRESKQETVDRYMAYAGTPVDNFSYLGSFSGWNSLGRDKLVVWTSVNRAYLLTVEPTCRDLEFAERIDLTSTGSTVTRFDRVRFRNGFHRDSCRITEIRPVDYGRMRKDSSDRK